MCRIVIVILNIWISFVYINDEESVNVHCNNNCLSWEPYKLHNALCEQMLKHVIGLNITSEFSENSSVD
jgi:hypothetical protein